MSILSTLNFFSTIINHKHFFKKLPTKENCSNKFLCFYVDQAISPAKLICGKNEAWFFVFCPKSSVMNKNRVWWGWIFQNLPVPHKETMPSKSTNPLHPFIAELKEKRPWFTISIQNGNVDVTLSLRYMWPYQILRQCNHMGCMGCLKRESFTGIGQMQH